MWCLFAQSPLWQLFDVSNIEEMKCLWFCILANEAGARLCGLGPTGERLNYLESIAAEVLNKMVLYIHIPCPIICCCSTFETNLNFCSYIVKAWLQTGVSDDSEMNIHTCGLFSLNILIHNLYLTLMNTRLHQVIYGLRRIQNETKLCNLLYPLQCWFLFFWGQWSHLRYGTVVIYACSIGVKSIGIACCSYHCKQSIYRGLLIRAYLCVCTGLLWFSS